MVPRFQLHRTLDLAAAAIIIGFLAPVFALLVFRDRYPVELKGALQRVGIDQLPQLFLVVRGEKTLFAIEP